MTERSTASRSSRVATTRLAAVVLVTTMASGCWVEPATRELGPPSPTTPRDPDRRDAGGRRPTTGRTLDGPQTVLESPGAVGTTPSRPDLALLPGGLRVVFTGGDVGICDIRLTIRHRNLPAHEIAVAKVTAEYLASAPLEGGSSTSLRVALSQVGATLDIGVMPQATWFTVRGPRDAWQKILEGLGKAIVQAPTSTERVDEVRDQELRRLTEEIGLDPVANAVARVRNFEFEGVGTWLAAAEDVTLGQVAAFWKRTYLSDGAVLAVRIADLPVPRLLRVVDERFTKWIGDRREALPAAIPPPAPASGLFWAAGPEPARVAAVLTPMPLSAPRAALEWIALECLTADGIGGRIGASLDEQIGTDPAFSPRFVDEGTSLRIELRAEMPTWSVRRVDRALRDAFRSLAEDAPGDETIRHAAARARLRLLTALRSPEQWLAWATHAAFAGLLPTTQWTGDALRDLDLPGGDPWQAIFDDLANIERRQVAEVLRSFADRRSLLVVVGGNPDPAEPTDTFARIQDAFVPTGRREVVTADESAQIASAEALRDRAIRAIGGAQRLPLVRGLTMRGITVSRRGPEMITEAYYARDGRLRQITHIMATEIETVVAPDGGFEAVPGRRVALSPTECASALAEFERHPLMLLASWATGTAAYRLLSLREVNDREIAILERIRGGEGRLRMHVDTESGLIRTVESEDLREVGLVYLREEYQDYRTSDVGVRVPHRRITLVDDGLRGLLTTWTQVEPIEPPAENFEPGPR